MKMNKKIKEKMEKVEIPEKFREQLERRFNPDNAVPPDNLFKEWKIYIPCPLCREFNHPCNGCPFKPFEKSSPREESSSRKEGCIVWIEKILEKPRAFNMETKYISWTIRKNKKAREQLDLLRKKAEELIIWIDEEVR